MLNRFSVKLLLKSLFGTMAMIIIVILAVSAWTSWGRLQSAKQIATVAETSVSLFTSLHNLRSDRIFSTRSLQAEASGDFSPIVRRARASETAAMTAGLASLRNVNLPAGGTAVSDITAMFEKLVALHKEADEAIKRPKAERRPALVDEYFKTTSGLMELLDKMSGHLTLLIKGEDPQIDQLMQVKSLAWVLRSAAGDGATFVSAAFDKKLDPIDVLPKFAGHTARATAALVTIEDIMKGVALPANLVEAVARARKEFLQSDYPDRQMAILKKSFAGEKQAYEVLEWDRVSNGVHTILLQVADTALQVAKDYATDLHDRAQRNLILQAGLLVLACALSIMVMLLISRRIINPLMLVQQTMVQLAGGNFNVALPRLTPKDEIGQIVMAVSAMVDQIRAIITEIKISTREVTSASAEIATSTTDLSQRTEEQAASLEETTASMEEISSTVRKNADNAKMASESAASTREVADRGGEVAAKAVNAMSRIEESSSKIADIIGVIDEIARQTNLLALNAAVEAARAGDAGRGFAVVASEVRSLAQRSSQAAKDISQLITNSSGQVQEGVSLVNQAGAALTEIVESIRTVAAVVSDIASASAEQATGLDEINKALTQMDNVTQQNSALVEENAATAKTLEGQAKSMDEQVAFFQIDAPQGENEKRPDPVESLRPASKLKPVAMARSSAAA